MIEDERLTSWLGWILLTEREEVCAGSANRPKQGHNRLLNMFECLCRSGAIISSSPTMAPPANRRASSTRRSVAASADPRPAPVPTILNELDRLVEGVAEPDRAVDEAASESSQCAKCSMTPHGVSDVPSESSHSPMCMMVSSAPIPDLDVYPPDV